MPKQLAVPITTTTPQASPSWISFYFLNQNWWQLKNQEKRCMEEKQIVSCTLATRWQDSINKSDNLAFKDRKSLSHTHTLLIEGRRASILQLSQPKIIDHDLSRLVLFKILDVFPSPTPKSWSNTVLKMHTDCSIWCCSHSNCIPKQKNSFAMLEAAMERDRKDKKQDKGLGRCNGRKLRKDEVESENQ